MKHLREKFKKRFLYLYTGELLAIISFILISCLLNLVYPELQLFSLYFFWGSFFLLEFILLQGIIYWRAKWKRLRNENISITPNKIINLLKFLKKINILLIFLCPILLYMDFLKCYQALPLKGLYISGFIYFFSLLEYINYYHIQLSYDNISDIRYLLKSKKLKQSCICKDFNINKNQ